MSTIWNCSIQHWRVGFLTSSRTNQQKNVEREIKPEAWYTIIVDYKYRICYVECIVWVGGPIGYTQQLFIENDSKRETKAFYDYVVA